MKFLKKLADFFVRPRLWFLILAAVTAVGAVVAATLFLTLESLAHFTYVGYISLGIMCLTAGYTVYGAVKVLPNVQERALEWSRSKPLFHRMFTEFGFRTILFSVGSFTLNIAFAVYNGSVAVAARSLWFGALAAYYILLIVVRGGILFYHARRKRAVKNGRSEKNIYLDDTKVYGACGVILVLLPVALSFAILQMVRANDSFVHTGLTIYVYAVYAFYKISMAIYHFVKTWHTKEMTVRASKNINLADAMVSILALQTAMLREFDTGDSVNVATMNAVTGAAVCALTALLGIFMAVNAYKKIKRASNLI